MDDNNKLLNLYVNTLVNNINSEKIPDEIDVIFDGGLFNGFIGYGTSVYINELQKQKKTKVVRVSGCSVGSVLALLYIVNAEKELDIDINNIFKKEINGFKENFNFSENVKILRELVYLLFEDDNLNMLNDRLYISYYDMKKIEKKIVHNFKNRDHLIECLIKSTHIPFISNNNFKYKKKYVDGLTPYIFRDNARPSLHIMLITFKNLSRIFFNSNEVNANSRIISGLADADEFFTCGKSNMCSYIKEWNYKRYLFIRVRELVCFFIIWFIEILIIITKKPFKLATRTRIYFGLKHIFIETYKDIMFKLVI
jgi:hypothetical protein